ncbi:MAG: NADPH-dependent oxidoreductase [Nitrospinota bacterium]|nr:MAG: NADPH-dependent oxidoreductase [Nitrospinota bacterium]
MTDTSLSMEHPPLLYAGLSDPSPENRTIRLLRSHRSIRAYYPTPLPDGTLDAIIAAAQQAPTSSNMQAYSIIAVQDPQRKQELMTLCSGQKFIAQCPLFLVFCADLSRLHYVCARQGYRYRAEHINMLIVACCDAQLACQNAAIAAESMGLGTVMVGDIRRRPREVAALLELPRYVFATVGLCIGYAATDPGIKPRLPRKVILHRETYSAEHLEEGLEEYDRAMIARGIYRKPFPIELVEEGAEERYTLETYGWTEHTARRVAELSHEERKGSFITFLREQGFPCE